MNDDITKIEEQEQHPLRRMLASPEIIKRFEMVCGREYGSLMTNILNAAAVNPEIWDCEPMSVINAALNAATCNLSISPALGFACILPFKKWKRDDEGNWTTDETRASFVIMKRGLREMAMRTNKYRVLNPFTLYEGMEWVEDIMSGRGTVKGMATSKKPIGYGAYLVLFNGYEATDYMSYEEMMAHVARYSPSWDKREKKIRKGSKWDTDFDMMAEGVVLKRLIRTKGVLSETDKRVLEETEAEVEGEVVDGHVSAHVDGHVSAHVDPQPALGNVSQPPAADVQEPVYEDIDVNPPSEEPTIPRPWNAQQVKDRIQVLIAEYEKKATIVTAEDRKVLASTLDTTFNSDKSKRYTVCRWLCGSTNGSTKELKPAHVKALMNWQNVKGFNDIPPEYAIKEALEVYTVAIKAEGQQELLPKEK